MERQFHDALSDTLYTADVCRMLDLRAGLAAYPTEEESLRASLSERASWNCRSMGSPKRVTTLSSVMPSPSLRCV